MKILKNSFPQLPIEILKFLIAFSAYLLDPSTAAFANVARVSVVTLVAMSLYFVVSYFKYFTRPLIISISLENKVTGEDRTNYFYYTLNSEAERTVRVEIKIKKSSSLFSWIALRMLKGKPCGIIVNTVPEDYFTLIPEVNHLIRRYSSGFIIDLSEMVKQLLGKGQGTLTRCFEFIIAENRDADINCNCDVSIMPEYAIDKKSISFLHRLIYDVNDRDSKHLIKFYRDYNGLKKEIM
ncbi:hypothetical protein SAMN02745133_01925 [Desulforamulus putei DSM 12395]|uniref:Uncharacterized protein n=1 Tax=Desulforamulus putei DSM 12395 TaxID=1121429 RepID=A0A1M4ZAP1_9FIRM|nr:hypothetical protein [Desulforamulus putei]SHF14832.1 hypothetical protein SAMN02745133_01925 [Desulforamulus putei DSM 12395]